MSRARQRPAGRRPTIIDVAARAGVSKSLVSLVMRGSSRVSVEKRDAVFEAAAALGYRPNAVARSLVEQTTRTLGVMVSDLRNPFFADMVHGMQEEATAVGYRLLFNTGCREVDQEAAALEMLLQLRVDGVVLAGAILGPKDLRRAREAAPLVLVGRRGRVPGVDTISLNEQAGAALAVEHLAGLGHRRIAHIDGGRGAGAAGRRRGYLRAMERLGLGHRARVASGDFTEAGGGRGVVALWDSKAAPTALFVANDLAAVGAMQALRARGLRVPQDVSVVGFDDTWLAALQHICLTTVRQPVRQMGRDAVRLLVERIGEARTRDRHLREQPELVTRKTTTRR